MRRFLILITAIVVCSCGGGKDSEWDLTLPKKGATDTGQVLKVKRGQAYWDASGEITGIDSIEFLPLPLRRHHVDEMLLCEDSVCLFEWDSITGTFRRHIRPRLSYSEMIRGSGSLSGAEDELGGGPHPFIPRDIITPPKIQQSKTLPPIREELHKQNK